MKGLFAGLATGIILAISLLMVAGGQARGEDAPSGLVQSETVKSSPVGDASTPDEYDYRAIDGDASFDLYTELISKAGTVIVAVLDTGIDSNHHDLSGRIIGEINLSSSQTAEDKNGHGTHIAGIISASRSSEAGIAGIASNSMLLNVKVSDDYGICDEANVARGIVWAVDNGARVINVSLELREPSSRLEEAVEYAWNRGALIVAAAGNDASTRPVYPAFYPHVLAVSATAGNKLAPLSNHGDWVDVAAPGLQVYSTLAGNKYGYESGTSFAAAKVSGLAALLYGLMADANGDGRLNDEVRFVIEDSAVHTPGLDTANGQVSFDGALSLVAGLQR